MKELNATINDAVISVLALNDLTLQQIEWFHSQASSRDHVGKRAEEDILVGSIAAVMHSEPEQLCYLHGPSLIFFTNTSQQRVVGQAYPTEGEGNRNFVVISIFLR